jgi:CO/xanthine dehydrogenase FAD-binding subunit
MNLEYARPHDLPEAIRLLSDSNGRAVVLAGGTDLVPALRCEPQPAGAERLLVDVKDIPELCSLWQDEAGRLHLGATVRVRDLLSSPAVRRGFPALAAGAAVLGSYPVRTLATIGGNICRASPVGDLLPPLLIYDATVIVAGPTGTRPVALDSFLLGPGQTDLRPGELLVEVLLPATPAGLSSGYRKQSPRRAMDLAVVSAAAAMIPGLAGRPTIRLALGGVAPVAFRPRLAENAWADGRATDWREVACLAAGECSPIDDLRASASYRRSVVAVIIRRLLEDLSGRPA